MARRPDAGLVPGHSIGRGIERSPLVLAEGKAASRRIEEFFTARIRNPNTRAAYLRGVGDFLAWCEGQGVGRLADVSSVTVAAWRESHPGAPATVKQQLAAVRSLFDWLVIGDVVPVNPASSVRGPRIVGRTGKTPVLELDDARSLFDSIDVDSVMGLRDRAVLGVMTFAFARVSSVVEMCVGDYYSQGRERWFRLGEGPDRLRELPAHPRAREYVDEYLRRGGAAGDKKAALFRTVDRRGALSDRRMARTDVYRMVKRRAAQAGLSDQISCHSFRATGITAFLANGGSLELAQALAGHESPNTTKLYDRRPFRATLAELKRIGI